MNTENEIQFIKKTPSLFPNTNIIKFEIGIHPNYVGKVDCVAISYGCLNYVCFNEEFTLKFCVGYNDTSAKVSLNTDSNDDLLYVTYSDEPVIYTIVHEMGCDIDPFHKSILGDFFDDDRVHIIYEGQGIDDEGPFELENQFVIDKDDDGNYQIINEDKQIILTFCEIGTPLFQSNDNTGFYFKDYGLILFEVENYSVIFYVKDLDRDEILKNNIKG